MKFHSKIYIVLLMLVVLACEEVIDLDLQTVPARLTIEASIDWEKGTLGNEQTIKLSESTPYFNMTTNTGVNGASVTVVNNNNLEEYIFTDLGNGNYTTSDFFPILNQAYTLEVLYNGERYSATETLMSVVDIAEVTQSNKGGFDNDALDVNVSFDDPENIDNFYLLRFKEQGDLLPRLFDVDDEFRDGNRIKIFFEKDKDLDEEEFVAGDTVAIDFFGISEDYRNYMRLLIRQNEGTGVFGGTPANVKGNCININNAENYAHGYFRLTQVVRTNYTFQ